MGNIICLFHLSIVINPTTILFTTLKYIWYKCINLSFFCWTLPLNITKIYLFFNAIIISRIKELMQYSWHVAILNTPLLCPISTIWEVTKSTIPSPGLLVRDNNEMQSQHIYICCKMLKFYNILKWWESFKLI